MKAALLSTDDYKFLDMLRKRKEPIVKLDGNQRNSTAKRSRSLTPHATLNKNMLTITPSR